MVSCPHSALKRQRKDLSHKSDTKDALLFIERRAFKHKKICDRYITFTGIGGPVFCLHFKMSPVSNIVS